MMGLFSHLSLFFYLFKQGNMWICMHGSNKNSELVAASGENVG